MKIEKLPVDRVPSGAKKTLIQKSDQQKALIVKSALNAYRQRHAGVKIC